MLLASYMDCMVTEVVLPINPVKVLLPKSGTTALTVNAGALDHALSNEPFHAVAKLFPLMAFKFATPLTQYKVSVLVVVEVDARLRVSFFFVHLTAVNIIAIITIAAREYF